MRNRRTSRWRLELEELKIMQDEVRSELEFKPSEDEGEVLKKYKLLNKCQELHIKDTRERGW